MALNLTGQAGGKLSLWTDGLKGRPYLTATLTSEVVQQQPKPPPPSPE